MMLDSLQFASRAIVILISASVATLCGSSHANDSSVNFTITQLSPTESKNQNADSVLRIPITENHDEELELQLLVDGQPLNATEERIFVLLFKHFDQNQDESLCVEESRYLPDLSRTAHQLWNPLGAKRNLRIATDDPPSFASQQAFIAWCRHQRIRFVHVGFGRDHASGALSRRLEEILQTFLNIPEAGFEREAALQRFKQIDANADGHLAANELIRDLAYPSTSASHPLTASIGQSTTNRYQINIPRSQESATSDGSTHFHRLGHFGSTTIFIRYDTGTSGQDIRTSETFLNNLFQEIDTDGDARLSEAELDTKTARLMRQYVSFADIDRDQSLSKDELVAWQRVWEQLVSVQLKVSIVDQNVGLWELFDQDMDGRLSAAEWFNGVENYRDLAVLDKRNRVDRKRQLRLTFSHGKPHNLTATASRAGAAWFRAADTNNDGYLQKDEFVGPLEIFTKLDSNGDGMISLTESHEDTSDDVRKSR